MDTNRCARFLGGLILLASATAAPCQIYKWTDRDGAVRYSDASPPQGAKPADVVAGCYFTGHEMSAFVPAGTKEWWWANWQVVDRALPREPLRDGQGLFVVIRGRLSKEGRYGHLGGYKRQITVSQLVSARKPLPEDQCEASLRREPEPRGARPSQHAESLYQQGLVMEETEAKEAVAFYARAARLGNGKAAKRLGHLYSTGVPGVPRNDVEAQRWYEMARELDGSVETRRKR